MKEPANHDTTQTDTKATAAKLSALLQPVRASGVEEEEEANK